MRHHTSCIQQRNYCPVESSPRLLFFSNRSQLSITGSGSIFYPDRLEIETRGFVARTVLAHDDGHEELPGETKSESRLFPRSLKYSKQLPTRYTATASFPTPSAEGGRKRQWKRRSRQEGTKQSARSRCWKTSRKMPSGLTVWQCGDERRLDTSRGGCGGWNNGRSTR